MHSTSRKGVAAELNIEGHHYFHGRRNNDREEQTEYCALPLLLPPAPAAVAADSSQIADGDCYCGQ